MPRERKDITTRFFLGDTPPNAGEPLYSEADELKILAALKTPDEARKWLPHIREAATTFSQARDAHSRRKLPSVVKKEAAKAVKTLNEAMDCYGRLQNERREIGRPSLGADNINFVVTQLAALKEDFVAVNEAWEGRGKPRTTVPREIFVGHLAYIWESATGKPPTRRTGTENTKVKPGVPYGPFLDFVTAALSPLGDTTGIADVVRNCLGNLTRK